MTKLNKLIHHIESNRNGPNKKVLIFTVFRDTAEYLYREMKELELQILLMFQAQ